MALKIDRVQLQFEIQPDYEQQELRRLEEDLKKANRALSQTEREIERVRKAKPSDPAQYAQWQKNLDALNAKYKEQVAAVQDAQRAIDKHTQQMGLQNLSLAQLTKRAQTLNTILRNLNPNSEAYQRYSQQLQLVNARIKELRGEATKTKLSLASMADGMNKYFLLVSSAVGSLTGLALTIRKCTDAYAQMEDVMASVRKYTGMTDAQVRDLNKSLSEMDTRTSIEGLNELAGAAGRLGLTAKKDIMEFVEAADMIGVALGDDLGESAVDTIGKLAIAFGEDDRLGLRGAMLATGSALNEIVQNSPAKAQPVIEFTERLSGVGQQAHMTQAQMMGFASALNQNNMEMATSATVMSQLITKMYKDPARFAQMAGMEVQSFAKLVRTDMNQALLDWLQASNKLGDMSVLASKFDELKMDGTRAVGVLANLTGHVDQVVEAQRLANEAYEEATSVGKEYEIQNTTVAAEIDKSKKKFGELTRELGEKLLPVARHAITAGSAGVRVLAGLTDTIGRYKGLIVTLTTAYVAYNTVLGIAWLWKQRVIAQLKAMYAIEAMQKALTNARTVATGLYNLALGKLTGNLTRASVAQAQLNTAMSANVIGAIVAAAVVLVAVLKNAYDEVTKLDAATQAMNDVNLEATKRASEEKVELELLVGTIKNANASEETRREALEKLNGKLMEKHLGNLTEEEVRTGKAAAAIDRYSQSLENRIKKEVLLEAMKDAMKKKMDAEAGNFEVTFWQRYDQLNRVLEAAFYHDSWNMKKNWNQINEEYRQQAIDTSEDVLATLQAEWNNLENQQFTIYDPRDHEPAAGNGGSSGSAEDSPRSSSATPPKGDADLRKEVNEARKAMKEREQLAKAEREMADLLAKQDYQQRLITDEEFHQRRYQNEKAYLEKMTEIRQSKYSTEAEKQEIQNQVLDSIINEANYQREQAQKQMQEQLQLMQQSYAADTLAIEQDFENGRIATEQEYQRRKIEAEIDYCEQRLAVIRAAGGDTLEAETALEQARLKLLQQNNNERERQLRRDADKDLLAAEKVNDYDAQMAIYKRMLDERLITQEQYEDELTRITEEKEAQRHQIREAFTEQAQQLLQSASSLFSALQSREEKRVDDKYKKLIASAKKQGKDTSKLEEQQEAEKLAIQKKYADKQFAMTVLQIVAQTALGIQKIWAEWGWNPPVAVGLTATTAAISAIQLATAKAQREQAAGLYTGGYSDEYTEGYTGDGNPRDVAGVIPVHRKEFVINHEALAVPAVRRVANVIDSMQKRKAYAMQNATAELQRVIAPPLTLPRGGLYRGGYTQSVATDGEPGIGTSRLEQLLERNNALLDEMRESGVTVLELRREIRKQEQLERNASRG